MKRVLKMFVRFFSLTAFATLVFLGGLLGRFSRNDQDSKMSNKLPQALFAGFDPNVAHADAAPSGSDGDPGDGAPCDSGSDSPSPADDC